MDFQSPKNVFKVWSFLGLAGYNHRFVKNFSSITFPLTKLTRKGVRFVWCDECEQAFQLLKTYLTSATILAILKRGVGYTIYCDASLNGLGCVLIQEGRVVAYSSNQLKPVIQVHCWLGCRGSEKKIK